MKKDLSGTNKAWTMTSKLTYEIFNLTFTWLIFHKLFNELTQTVLRRLVRALRRHQFNS